MEHTLSNGITTIVRRRVRPGQQAGYEAWLAALLVDAKQFAGYLGTEVQKPVAPDRNYVSVFRFATLADLDAFECSEVLRSHIAKVVPFVEADATSERMSGLEVWFNAPAGTVAPQPVRWKMALLLTALVFALVEVLSAVLRIAAPDLPPRLALLTIVTAQVCLLTYVIMPPVTRWLAFWLFPNPARQNKD